MNLLAVSAGSVAILRKLAFWTMLRRGSLAEFTLSEPTKGASPSPYCWTPATRRSHRTSPRCHPFADERCTHPFRLLHAKVALLGFRHTSDARQWRLRLIVSTGNWTRQTLEESLDLAWRIDLSDQDLKSDDSLVPQACADLRAAWGMLDWLRGHFDVRVLNARAPGRQDFESELTSVERWIAKAIKLGIGVHAAIFRQSRNFPPCSVTGIGAEAYFAVSPKLPRHGFRLLRVVGQSQQDTVGTQEHRRYTSGSGITYSATRNRHLRKSQGMPGRGEFRAFVQQCRLEGARRGPARILQGILDHYMQNSFSAPTTGKIPISATAHGSTWAQATSPAPALRTRWPLKAAILKRGWSSHPTRCNGVPPREYRPSLF